MYEDQIQHLLKRKQEIDEVSPWARVKLRVIKEDLAPLIEKGVPIKHLIRILQPLEITSRKDTLRKFIIQEFPEAYARYYAKMRKASAITKELDKNKGNDHRTIPSSDKASEQNGADAKENRINEVEETVGRRKAQKLDPKELASALSNFNSGKT